MPTLKITKVPTNKAIPLEIRESLLNIELPYEIPSEETYNHQVNSGVLIKALRAEAKYKTIAYYQKITGRQNVPVGFPKNICEIIY